MHNVSMRHSEWIQNLPGQPSVSAIARKTDIQKTTLLRQLDRGVVPAENVILIARAYALSPVDSLIQCGYLDAGEVSIVGVDLALRHATNAQLLAEIEQRVDPEAVRIFQGEGDQITPDFANDDLPDPSQFRLAARKSDPRPDDSADL